MTKHNNILLIGANGQVGHALQKTLAALGPVVTSTRADLDLGDRAALPQAIAALVGRTQPCIIVNASAYTAVDRAESEPQAAETVNAIAPGLLAEAAHAAGACIVHYSTDYVFDGLSPGAYRETDTTHPLSVYGQSKLQGEQAVARACPRHLILRTLSAKIRLGASSVSCRGSKRRSYFGVTSPGAKSHPRFCTCNCFSK